MGGKVWSVDEERTFWGYIIPRSQKRVGVDEANPTKSWEELAKDMKERMAEKGRREYTSLGLFEHFFQNAVKQRYSPNAAKFASEYIRRAKADGGETLRDDRDRPGRAKSKEPQPRGRRRDEDIHASPRPNLNRASPQVPARARLSHRRPADDKASRSPSKERDDEEKPSPAIKRDDGERPSSTMKREPDPLHSEADFEADLPPFIPRAAGTPSQHPAYRGQGLHTSPGDVQNDYPVVHDSDDWDDEAITNSARRYGPSPSIPRNRTAQMEARMERRYETPSRIRQQARRGTPGSAVSTRGFDSPSHGYEAPRVFDDPFVDPNTPLHRDRDVVMGNDPDTHQSPARHHHQGNGMPTGNGYHSYGRPQMTGLAMTGSEYYQARQGHMGQQFMGAAHHEAQWNVRASPYREAMDRANQHLAAQRAHMAQNNGVWQQDHSAGGHGRDDHGNGQHYRGPMAHGPNYSSSYYNNATSYERRGPGASHNFNSMDAGAVNAQRGDMSPPARARQGDQVGSPGHDETSNTSHNDNHEDHDNEDADSQPAQEQSPESDSHGDHAQNVNPDADAEGEADPDEPEPQQVTNVPDVHQPQDDQYEEVDGEGEMF